MDPVDPTDKVLALVRSTGAASAADREAVWTELVTNAERLVESSPPAGLVLSKMLTPFVEGDPLIALIELWGVAAGAEQSLVARLVPEATRQAHGLSVSVAGCSEIVFRQVHDFARPGSRWSVKLSGTAFRRDDFDPDAFFEYWVGTHAPIGGSVPGIGGYTVSRAIRGQIGEESADALISQWYESEQAFTDAQETEQAKAAWNDVGNYAKTTGTAFWLLTEQVLVEPPATGPGTLEV